MGFKPDKIAFGRHESFALRYGWLTKGFQAFEHDHDILRSPDAIVTLGVGKNMVNAIRQWLRAARVIEITPDEKKPLPLGKAIFSKENGWKPTLKTRPQSGSFDDEDTRLYLLARPIEDCLAECGDGGNINV